MATTIGEKTTKRLAACASALEKNQAISEHFTCRWIALDLKPQSYDPELVRKTREAFGLSQSLFAQFLGVSVKTVSSWECGAKSPQPIACQFMDEIRKAPAYWRKRLSEIAKPTARG